MLRELEKILNNSTQELTQQDLKHAAARLREKQFIFKDRRGQSRTYDILVNQQEYFSDLFDAFGDEFFVDQHFGYCGILPNTSRPILRQLETIFLLILAKMHDLECRKARSENGRTNPSEAILLDEYSELTGREKPKPQETRSALERLARVGVIELGEFNEMSEMREIVILPSIMKVVSSSYLDSLSGFQKEQVDQGTSAGDESSSEESIIDSDLDNSNDAYSGEMQ